MASRVALAFTGEGANNAIRGLMGEYEAALAEIGWSVSNVEQSPSAIQAAIDRMAAGEIGFALTWLGFGQDLAVVVGPDKQRVNAWEFFNVPCLKLHGDLPAYFSQRHADLPRNSVNLYHAAEFAHFRRHWLPEARSLAAVLPALPLSMLEPTRVDVAKRRSGKLVFIKNGNPPERLRELWNERLPQATARMLSEAADEIVPIALKPGRIDIGDFVGRYFESQLIDPRTVRDLHLFFSAQLDDFLRRVKSNMIANALLDLPVIVTGSNWEHVDFSGARARLAPGLDYAATSRIYLEELGIVDMSPNVDTWPHDRVQRAAGTYAVALTNRQSWFQDGFGSLTDLTFEFEPGSITARAADVIANPQRYLDLAMAFGERFRARYPRDAFACRIVDMAETASFLWSSAKPQIQPFFAWPQPPAAAAKAP